MRLPFLYEKSGAIALVLPDFMAGLASWQADEIVLDFEIFKIIYWMKYLTFAMFSKGRMLL